MTAHEIIAAALALVERSTASLKMRAADRDEIKAEASKLADAAANLTETTALVRASNGTKAPLWRLALVESARDSSKEIYVYCNKEGRVTQSYHKATPVRECEEWWEVRGHTLREVREMIEADDPAVEKKENVKLLESGEDEIEDEETEVEA